MTFRRHKIFLFVVIILAPFFVASLACATTAVYNTTSSLTIPGAQNAYSMNFSAGIPATWGFFGPITRKFINE